MATNLDPASGSLASLLAAMDCLTLEVVGREVIIVGALPPWLAELSHADPRAVDIISLLPLLEIFLKDAIAFWAKGNPGRFSSDFWTQTNLKGEEIHLLAFAAVIEGRQLIVIRAANDLYEERQRWQLHSHQTTMQLQLIERLKGELQAANDRLSELSIRDGLTGLYNRRHFDQVFEQELGRTLRSGKSFSLLFMDIDKFKVLNDTYGHSVGDDCLRAIAKVLTKTVSRPTDLVARFGGEEFVILLPGTDAANAFKIATEINKAVRALKFPNKDSDVDPYVTASLGAYTWQKDSHRAADEILKSVDAALYRAKKQGRNRVAVATTLEPPKKPGSRK